MRLSATRRHKVRRFFRRLWRAITFTKPVPLSFPSIPDGCLHVGTIVEDKHLPDGSIDGRCTACGADGFPIVDKAYEKWLEELERA